jgi:prepilin-type N-terminal cleavage/methylation domain-containing protein/prepilin-type processing-associated H-X9-DG protein
MFHSSNRRTRTSHAFTLVELLVVIGIIALLISILLPSLSRAREEGNRIKCLSNMRQLAQAFIMYANSHQKDTLPRPAGGGATTEDWIYWETTRDINESRIAPFISGSKFNVEVLRCPSDNWAERTNDYKYSYCVNFNICKLPGTPANAAEALFRGKPMKLSQIRNSTNKILVIEESWNTIDDGCWAWQPEMGKGKNVMSIRHDKKNEQIAGSGGNPSNTTDFTIGRGNVAFSDGHGEFIERADSFKEEYWNPIK